jgi:hypothetical protein
MVPPAGVFAIDLFNWMPSASVHTAVWPAAEKVDAPLAVISSPAVPTAVLALAVPTANASNIVARTAEKTTEVRRMRFMLLCKGWLA